MSAHCHPICLEWEGNIKCKILPPRDICYTLPVQEQFETDVPLSYTNSDKMYQEVCTHCDHERNVAGTSIVDPKQTSDTICDVRKSFRAN